MKLVYPYISALILTIVLESAALYMLGVRSKRDYLVLLLINISTNITLNVLYRGNMIYNVIDGYLLLALLEAAVIVTEAWLISRCFESTVDPLKTSIVLNLFSFLGGLLWNYIF